METKTKGMTEADAVKAFLAGAQLMVVEYRGSRTDHISWMDKTTRVRKEADLCKHTVEAGPLSFAVTERMPDDWDPASLVAPFPKGTRCLLEFRNFSFDRGSAEADGKLIPLLK